MNITTSITNTSLKNSDNYFGEQIRLAAEENGISFKTTTESLQDLAIVKAKRLIAEAQVFVPDPEPEYVPDDEPAQSEATSEAPASETD